MHTEPAVKGTAAKAKWLWHASKAQEWVSMTWAYNILQSSSLTFMRGHRMSQKQWFLTQFWWVEHYEVSAANWGQNDL